MLWCLTEVAQPYNALKPMGPDAFINTGAQTVATEFLNYKNGTITYNSLATC